MHHDYVTLFKKLRGARLASIAMLVVMPLIMTSCTGLGSTGGGSTATTVASKMPKFKKATTMATIQARGKLIVGVVPNLAPFSYEDSNTGTWQGFDVEVARQIARSIFGNDIENRIQWIPLETRDREGALREQRVDIALGRYTISVARKQFVDFAGPYYQATQDVISLRQRSANTAGNLTTLAQLNGKRVCVVTGSTNLDPLSVLVPTADFSVVEPTAALCGARLIAGEVDAVAADHVDLLAFRGTAGNTLNVISNGYGAQPYGVGVKLDVLDLRSHVNSVLENWEGYGAAYARTTGDNTRRAPAVDRY